MKTRREFLRLTALATGALVLPGEQFVRRYFPVGISLPRTFRVATVAEWQLAMRNARGGDTVHIVDTIQGTTEAPLVVPRPRGQGWITVTADPDRAQQYPPPSSLRNDATAQWLVAYNRIAPTNDPGVFRSIGPIRSDDLDYKVYPMLAGGRRR